MGMSPYVHKQWLSNRDTQTRKTLCVFLVENLQADFHILIGRCRLGNTDYRCLEAPVNI